MSNNNCFTCIIPFFNEGENTLHVIKAVSQVNRINQIICVDDGSTDGISKRIKQDFPNISLVKLNKNQGKSKAMVAGTKRAECDNLLLIDADLQNTNSEEIVRALTRYEENSLDMLILRNKGDNQLIDSFLRKDIFQSGKRILKRAVLENALIGAPVGYQLEVAINKYTMDKGKNVAWIENSAYNPHKTKKGKFFEGWKEDLEMDRSIISYLGLWNYLLQILLFCRKEVKL